MGVRRCLARSLTSLAFRCALQRVQTVPAAIHSGRIPLHNQLPTGTEDSGGGFRGTGHGPLRPLIVSNLRGDGNLVAATTYFR